MTRLAQDNFSGSAGTNLAGRSADVSGGTWTADSIFGSPLVLDGSGGCYLSKGSAGVAYLGASVSSFDETAVITPQSAGTGQAGLVFGDGSGNFVWARLNYGSGLYDAYRFNGSSYTKLNAATGAPVSPTAATTLRLTRTPDGVFTVYLNGSQVDTFNETTIGTGRFGIGTNSGAAATSGVHLSAFQASTQGNTPGFALSPGNATTGQPGMITVSGSNTAWTSSTSFAVTGGSGASISGASVNAPAQTATFTLNPGSASCTLTIANSTDSSTGTVAVAAPAITILPANLWDNAYSNQLTDNGETYYTNSVNAKLVMPATTATALTLGVHKSVNETVNGRIGLRINGVDSGSIAVPNLGFNAVAIDLTTKAGYVSGTNAVEIIAGSQTLQSGQVTGTYLTSISATGDSNLAFATPVVGNGRVVIVGDSIATGAYANDSTGTPAFMLVGWAALLRDRLGNGKVLVEAYGSAQLQNFVNNQATATSFAAHLAAQQSGNSGPHLYWIAIGTNDYTGGTSASTFAGWYGMLLDAIRAADSSAIIYCQSPLIRVTETANNAGNTLDDFRASIASLCSSRPFARYINGKTIVPLADIGDAQVHPTAAGHAIYEGYAAGILDGANFASTAPSSSPSASTYSLVLPASATVGQAANIGVLLDQPAGPAGVVVTLTDPNATLTGNGTVSIAAGSSYGAVRYTPNTAGSHTIGVGHAGQSGISDPTSGLTLSVAAATVAATAVTGLTLQLGATSGYVGQAIDYVVCPVGGIPRSAIGYTIGGLGASILGTFAANATEQVGTFTVGSAGTLTPTLTLGSGGSGLTSAVAPSGFTATAPPTVAPAPTALTLYLDQGGYVGQQLAAVAALDAPAQAPVNFGGTVAGTTYSGTIAVGRTSASASFSPATVGTSSPTVAITSGGPGISATPASSSFAAVAAPVVASPATGVLVTIGSPAGITGQTIELFASLVGGSALGQAVTVAVAGFTSGSPITITIPPGQLGAASSFVVGAPGLITPVVTLGGGNAGMAPTLNLASFTAQAATPASSATVAVATDAQGRVILAPNGLDAIQVEAGVNARQAFSPILAATAGIVSGAGTGVIVIKGGNSASTRITAITDNAGNRASVTLSLPA